MGFILGSRDPKVTGTKKTQKILHHSWSGTCWVWDLPETSVAITTIAPRQWGSLTKIQGTASLARGGQTAETPL